MEELSNITEYSEFKEAMDTEMKRSVESFVRIGYLLRRAKDTNILTGSGYRSVVEFAQAEYNIDKTQVSRFIAINERFSINGYSDQLQDKYNRFGLAKLQEMLQLPDSVVEELSPDMTRETIQEVKKEIKEELETTDIEVMLEEKNITEESMIYQALYLLFYEKTDRFEDMYKLGCNSNFNEIKPDEIMETLAPSGTMAEFVRISGVGKIFITIKFESALVVATNARSNEKESIAVGDVLSWFNKKYNPKYAKDFKEVWQQTYGEEYPQKEIPETKTTESAENTHTEVKSKVAPVQHKNVDKKPVKSEKVDKITQIEEKDSTESSESKVKNTNVEQEIEHESPTDTINTHSESDSTTNLSTQDHRAVVFGEMQAVTEKMMNCIKTFDEAGTRQHMKELQGILDSMAADNITDIPGQISMDGIEE